MGEVKLKIFAFNKNLFSIFAFIHHFIAFYNLFDLISRRIVVESFSPRAKREKLSLGSVEYFNRVNLTLTF